MSWQDDRLGHITASRVHRLMSNRFETVKKFISELIDERQNGAKIKFSTSATEHGKVQETTALRHYIAYTEREAELKFEVFLKHPNVPFVGCSPDGLVYDNQFIKSGIEIKCPFTLKAHTNLFDLKKRFKMPYFWQIQHSLYVTNAEFWDFVSYFKGQKLWIERFYPQLHLYAALVERCEWASEFLKKAQVITEDDFAKVSPVKLEGKLRGQAITYVEEDKNEHQVVADGTLLDYVGL